MQEECLHRLQRRIAVVYDSTKKEHQVFNLERQCFTLFVSQLEFGVTMVTIFPTDNDRK